MVKPTQEALKAAQSFLVNRVYLESELLNARIYNFATITGFLIAAYALGSGQSTQRPISYFVAILGLSLSLFNFSLGVLTGLATAFWREYLRRVERQLEVSLDTALFDFYEKPEGVKTLVGILRAADQGRLVRNTIPWCWGASRTTYLLVGAWVPGLLSLFWYFIIVRLVYDDVGASAAVAVTVLVLAVAVALRRRWMPSGIEGEDGRHA